LSRRCSPPGLLATGTIVRGSPVAESLPAPRGACAANRLPGGWPCDSVHGVDDDLITERLRLRAFEATDVDAILTDRRDASWAEDFPSEGDRVIADMLNRTGLPAPDDRRYGIRLVVESASGLLIGGVGFFGPPENGVVEIGYGVVPSREGLGYATEAVAAMIADATSDPVLTQIRAGVELSNPASIRVLEKNGFSEVTRDDEQASYELPVRTAV
jgi:ribosomal-protein-alanine N-acetyltransferase